MKKLVCFLLSVFILGTVTPLFAKDGGPKPVVTLGSPDMRWKAQHSSVAINLDGSILMFASSPEELTLIDPKTNKVIRTIATEKKGFIYEPHFTKDGSGIYIIQDNKYTLYDVKTGKEIASINLPAPIKPGQGILGPKNRYFPTYDGKKVAVSVLYENHVPIRIWDVTANKSLGEIKPNQNNDGHYCSWTGDGSLLSICGYRPDKKNLKDEALNEYIDFYDGKTFKYQFRIHAGEGTSISRQELSPDGKMLVTDGSGSSNYQLFDVTQKKRIRELKIPQDEFAVRTLCFSADSKKICVQLESGGNYVWDTKTLEMIGSKKVKRYLPGGIGFVSEKEILVSGIDRNDVILFDLMKEPTKTAELAHMKMVFATTFSKDGKYFYSGGLEQKVIRWDLATGKPVDIVVHPPERIFQDWTAERTFFSPDQDYIFVGYSSSGALANLDGKGGATFLINGKFFPNWQHVKIAADGKSVYAWGRAQEKTETGNKLESNAYACHWNINGKVIKEGAGKIRQDADDYFKSQFPDPKFLLHPIEDPANPLIVLGKETVDPKDPKRKLVPITIKSRQDEKVLLELNLPLSHPKGISFSNDGTLVGIPLVDHTIQIFKLR